MPCDVVATDAHEADLQQVARTQTQQTINQKLAGIKAGPSSADAFVKSFLAKALATLEAVPFPASVCIDIYIYIDLYTYTHTKPNLVVCRCCLKIICIVLQNVINSC